jgi:hypothetical protein
VDLTAWLLRRAPIRPFVVATPGGTTARLAVERFVREHGWRSAISPAEANLLVITGPEAPLLAPFLDRVWDAMPAPRARTSVHHPLDAPSTLDAVVAALRDPAVQRREASHAARVQPAAGPQHSPSTSSCGAGMPDEEHSAHEGHSEHHEHAHSDAQGDHDSHTSPEDPGGHAGHEGHHGHEVSGMEMPGGVPMADRGPDRDGLMLDQLHLPLGPALPDWPAGLIVHTVVQGDVIQQAEVELLGPGEPRNDITVHSALVNRLDSAACLLSVAGWPDMAARARWLRDDALTDQPTAHLEPRLRRWATTVRRSRALRWSLSGVGATEGGDALSRLYGWVDGTEIGRPMPVDELPSLLIGTELASARLVVASLDLDLAADKVVAHG